jgi:hypothetical protein
MNGKWLWVPAVCLILTAGCGSTTNQQGQGAGAGVSMKANDTTSGDRIKTQVFHGNAQLAADPYLETYIQGMDEVSDARVMTTDKNVYVAVVLDKPYQSRAYETQTGTANADNGNAPGTRDRISPINSGITDGSPNGDIPFMVKQKIIGKVRTRDGYRPVYVSSDPEFFREMDRMSTDARNGKPVPLRAFNSVVQRVFHGETPVDQISR